MCRKIPPGIAAHYTTLINGAEFKRADGTVIREQTVFTELEISKMKRLIDPVLASAWNALAELSGENLLPRVFDALWHSAAQNWTTIRNHQGNPRKTLTIRKLNQIVSAADKIERLLEELGEIVGPVDGSGARFPDKYPDSSRLREELEDLRERCRRFDAAGISIDPAIAAGIAARETGREFAHALVASLDEIGFPWGERRTPPKPLIELAAAVCEGVDYAALYAVLQLTPKILRD